MAILVAAGAAEAQVPAADSQPPKKKPGGLFGKMKSIAGNKTVQSVAKTAACTMVPGGQVIAGAIDAAGAAAGTSCMGGLGGSGLAGAAAQTGAAAAVSGGLPGVPGGAVALPTSAMGYSAGDPTDMPGLAQMAQCMGLTPDEYGELINPTGGEGRQPTNDEMKRQADLGRKVDVRKYQSCMMQAMPSPGR
jgi:hypothetical protein